MYAAEAGLPEVLRALLAAGADPDAQDAEGRTALMYAADHCQTESARSLVQAGVVVTLKDSNGYTALKRVRRKPWWVGTGLEQRSCARPPSQNPPSGFPATGSPGCTRGMAVRP